MDRKYFVFNSLLEKKCTKLIAFCIASTKDVNNYGPEHLTVPKMKTGRRRASDIGDIYEWLRRRSPSPNKLLILPGL